MPLAARPAPAKSSLGLVTIGVFKLTKSILLCAFGFALIHWRHEDLGKLVSHWINTLWISRPFFDHLVSSLSSLNEKTLKHFAVGAFAYSALLLIEGVGLCCRKRWAEFLSVGITGSLLPVEFYELSRHLTPARIIITVVNVAIVWYLVVLIIHDRSSERFNSAEPTE